MESIPDNCLNVYSFYNYKKEKYANSSIPLYKLIKLYNKYLHKKYNRNDLNFGWKELTDGWKTYYESVGEYFERKDNDNNETEEPEPLDDEINWIVWWCYTQAPEDVKCIFNVDQLVSLIMTYHHIPNDYIDLIQFIVKTIIKYNV